MVEDGGRKIIPPEPSDGRALGRTLAESAAELVPGGSLLTGLLRVTHPPKAEQEQGRWRRDVSSRTNENSAQLASLTNQMKLVISAFVKMKTYHKHASDAGELTFFRSGMLATLAKIASGQGTPEDQQRLRDQLAETRAEVDDIINGLNIALQSLECDDVFAMHLHAVIYGRVGKLTVRQSIQEIIDGDLANPALPGIADQVCNDIDEFNRAVIDLGRAASGAWAA
ncbi:hypothetical protein [Mesorhizobium sp. WSM1497]|uniref:hypothetical protein n=1 Tax=Mesorhizobium sp. WSM1497 TaxID=278153 RepID=UPI000B17780E|nr:hypothetical protein [Mesorhizobium sp. WSM1497]